MFCDSYRCCTAVKDLTVITCEGGAVQVTQQVVALGGPHESTEAPVGPAQGLVHVLEGHGEGFDRVAYKLQLVLEVQGLPGQALLGGADAAILLVVRGCRTVGVTALEVVLPEL